MPWTSQQIEVFLVYLFSALSSSDTVGSCSLSPLLELQQLGDLIGQIPPSFNTSRQCQQVIVGWRQYVAPHTPQQSDLHKLSQLEFPSR